MRVLSASGVEAESELPFAGLHQLLWPVLDRADGLPDVQRAAIHGAFGLSADAVPDRFLVSLAVLALLTAVADEEPLLCVVDDAHWLDRASGDALLFAARRLQADPVAILAAAREVEGRRFVAAGIPELVLDGLPDSEASALLDEGLPGGDPPPARPPHARQPARPARAAPRPERGPAVGARPAAARRAAQRRDRGRLPRPGPAAARGHAAAAHARRRRRQPGARHGAGRGSAPRASRAAPSTPPSAPDCSTRTASACASATRSCARRSTGP